MIYKAINNFLEVVKNSDIELYNEAGFQYELAFYLKEQLGDKFKIQLERNIQDIIGSKDFTKKELDIYLEDLESQEKYCIELKVPNSYQIPRRMQLSLNDVAFLESLVYQAGFKAGYFLFLSPNKSFWNAPRADQNIYKYFNSKNVEFQTLKVEDVPEFIKKDADDKGIVVKLKNKYKEPWLDLKSQGKDYWRYFMITIKE
jgi:hypothetical protein